MRRVANAALLRKCEHLQIAGSQRGLAWKAVAQPHVPMALLAQRHRDWGCLLVLPPQTSNLNFGFSEGGLRQPCSEIRTSADSSQAERSSLICPWHCSHRGTETGVACLFCPLKLQTYLRWCVPGASGTLLPKCERLQIAGSQKELVWKAVAQPHLPMALLAQRHRDWGCLLVLPPQTSNLSLGFRVGHFRQPCSENANVCR